jgi:hypothetical protein
MATYSAYTCYEVHGSRVESGTQDSFTASVQLQCAASLRFTIADDILGTPRSYPYFAAAKATGVGISFIPAEYTTSGQACEYDQALLNVTYSTQDADLVSEVLEPTSEFRTLDHRRFRWGSATGALLNESSAPGVLVRGLNLTRTYYKLASVPSTLLTLPGSCNSSGYTSSLLGLTFAAETLLFGTPNLTRSFKMSGTEGFNLTMKFSYNPNGWNKFYNEQAQAYQNIYLAGGGIYKPYPPASFGALLA